MKQGEIYRVTLDPVIGLEVGGDQLVVVVSNDLFNGVTEDLARAFVEKGDP